MWVAAFVALLVLVVVIRIARRAGRNSPERQLGRMLSPDAADRLIRHELKLTPGLSRSQAARRALERAMYDRGR